MPRTATKPSAPRVPRPYFRGSFARSAMLRLRVRPEHVEPLLALVTRERARLERIGQER